VIDPEAVSEAVARCSSVAALSGGAGGEVATYLRGRRVTGVRLRDDEVEVHVVARWTSPLSAVGDEVRAMLRPLVGDVPVSLHIDDIQSPSVA
jgi:hypothetical protein